MNGTNAASSEECEACRDATNAMRNEGGGEVGEAGAVSTGKCIVHFATRSGAP